MTITKADIKEITQIISSYEKVLRATHQLNFDKFSRYQQLQGLLTDLSEELPE